MKVAFYRSGQCRNDPDALCTLTPRGTTATCFRCAGMAGTAATGSVSLSFAARQASIDPDLLFEGHSAALDFVFLMGERVPPDYRGDAIVALKGSWNRSKPTGYKVVRVKFEQGRPAGWYDNFMTGFWTEGEDRALVWGRPADVALAPDGMMFVVDDTGGTIWRVTPKTDQATGSIKPSSAKP